MRNNDVRYRVDPRNPPPLTDEQKAQLKALADMGDENIDFSDIPLASEHFGKFKQTLFRPTKSSTTIRLDSDVLAWCRSKGKGYQTRINAILRLAMLTERRNAIVGISVPRYPVVRLEFADGTTGEYDFSTDIARLAPYLDKLRNKATFGQVMLAPKGLQFGWDLQADNGKIEYTSTFIRGLIERTIGVGSVGRLAAE